MKGLILEGELRTYSRKDGSQALVNNVKVAFARQRPEDGKGGFQVSTVRCDPETLRRILPMLPVIGEIEMTAQEAYGRTEPIISGVGDAKQIAKLF